ncbi:MAG: hypothetical protein LBE08_11660 [Bifidobacteriaceae bacterium]|jgi:electron transfer flavoprotein alpha/beta subunit|nr:hypothetical protein [Bifidobacteriaceae bacterium]
MHVAVCLKQVYDPDSTFRQTDRAERLDDSGLVRVVNPADKTALLLGAQLAPDSTVTALAVGEEDAVAPLRWALAHGATEALRLWDPTLPSGLSGPSVARLLASAVRLLGAELVLVGARTSGYVGAALAEELAFTQIDHVVWAEHRPDGLRALRKLDRGMRELVAAPLPVVLSADAATEPIPPVGLPLRLRAARHEIPTWGLRELSLEARDLPAPNSSVSAYVPTRRRTKRSAADKGMTPQQRMAQLMGGGRAGKSDSKKVVEGPPAKLASALLDFLKTKDLL